MIKLRGILLFRFFLIISLLITQTSYAATGIKNNINSLKNINSHENQLIFKENNVNGSLVLKDNQFSSLMVSSYLNSEDVPLKACQSSCGDGNNFITPSKIFISPDGRVLTSTTPGIKKGQNIFKEWENSNVSNFDGLKLGPIAKVSSDQLQGDNILLFENSDTGQFGLIRSIWTSLSNSGKANAQELEQIEIAVYDNEQLRQTPCELSTECILKAATGTLFPEIGLCKFEGICKKACKEIRVTLEEIAKAAFFGACSTVAAIIKAEATDGVSVIVSVIIAAVGCLVGCATPFIDVKLDEFCKDVNKIEDDIAKAYCSVYPEATDVTIDSGLATGIGTGDRNSNVSISGKFSLEEQPDIANSSLRIENFLTETDGAGEIVRENTTDTDNFLFPYLLPQRENTGSVTLEQTDGIFVFETPEGITPNFMVVIERDAIDQNSYSYTIDASDVTATDLPSSCDPDNITSEIMTKFFIDDKQAVPTVVTALEQWECETAGAGTISINLEEEPDTTGSGCSIAPKNSGTALDLLLFLLIPFIFRYRRKK